MARHLLLILFFMTSVSQLRCSLEKNSAKKTTTPPIVLEKVYSFSLANCRTGEHVFSSDNESLLLRDFCTALQDDALNQDCGTKERTQLYEANQCDSVLNLMDIKTEVKNEGSPTSQATNIKLNPVLTFDAITPTPFSLGPQKQQLQFLWATQTHNFLKSIPENWKFESESILRDFSQCGFDYFGPNCLEGQKKTLLHEGVFTNMSLRYAFFTFTYSESQKIFSLLFSLNENNQIMTDGGKAYLFGVAHRDRAHDAKFIFSKNSAVPLGEISYSKLTRQNYKDFSRSSHDMRSQMRLVFYEDELTHFFNENVMNTVNMTINDVSLKLGTYDITKEDLNETADHNALFLYFKYYKEHSSTDDYANFLGVSRNSPLKLIALHAQLATIRLGILNTEDIMPLIKALGQDNQELIRIAFSSMESLTIIPSPLKIALARLLGDEREYIQIKASEILIKYQLDVPSIVKITEVIGRNSKTPSIYLRALNVLSSSALAAVNQSVLPLINHRDKDLRRAVGLFLQERLPLENTLLPDLGAIVESPYPENRILSLFFIDSIPTEEATLLLVQKLLKIDATLRDNLIKILRSRNNYTDMHVDDLAKLQPRKEAELSFTGLELMLRIKTPLAANAIIDRQIGWLTRMNDKTERDLIAYTLEHLYAFTFSPINAFNLKIFSRSSYQKFDAMIDFLASIEGDFDEVSLAIIDFLIPANDTQQEKIYRYLESRSLGGDSLMTLAINFLSHTPDPKYPQQQINFDKTLELINARDHAGAQMALASIMGMSDPSLRSWAIARLDALKIDPSIGDKFARLLTGELVFDDKDVGKLKYFSPYEETRAAATKYLKETMSPEGFAWIVRYLLMGDGDRTGKTFFTPALRDEHAKLVKYYLLSLDSPDDIPALFLDELYQGIKYGEKYGQMLMLSMLPLIPRCDILEFLRQKAETSKGLDKDLLNSVQTAIDEIEKTLGTVCLSAIK